MFTMKLISRRDLESFDPNYCLLSVVTPFECILYVIPLDPITKHRFISCQLFVKTSVAVKWSLFFVCLFWIHFRFCLYSFQSYRLAKPWRSPPTSNGLLNCPSTLAMQMSSSTPLHFSPGLNLSPAPMSSATTRMSLDLFQKSTLRYQMEQPSRPSLTTGPSLLFPWRAIQASLLTTPVWYFVVAVVPFDRFPWSIIQISLSRPWRTAFPCHRCHNNVTPEELGCQLIYLRLLQLNRRRI